MTTATANTPWTTKRPDTEAGARQAFEDATGTRATSGAVFTPDPAVAGVWAVKNAWEHGGDAILYMAGYSNPWGVTRESSDVDG